MLTLKGSIKDGMVMLDEPVQGREGERVLIMFLEVDDAIRRIPSNLLG